jgi:NitT/TauT family transport system substrate-binding protein
LAGAAGLIRTPPALAAERPLETTTVRLAKNAGICIAPQYVAEELLRVEGFTDARYVATEAGIGQSEAIGRSEVDFSLNFAAPVIIPLDAARRSRSLPGFTWAASSCSARLASAALRI